MHIIFVSLKVYQYLQRSVVDGGSNESGHCGENESVEAHEFPGDFFELLQDQRMSAVKDIHHEPAAKGVLHHFHAALVVAHGIMVAPQHQGHAGVSPYREVELLQIIKREIASRRQ